MDSMYLVKTSALRTQPIMLPRWGTLLTYGSALVTNRLRSPAMGNLGNKKNETKCKQKQHTKYYIWFSDRAGIKLVTSCLLTFFTCQTTCWHFSIVTIVTRSWPWIVRHSVMLKVTWRLFDQPAKQLVVGRMTTHRSTCHGHGQPDHVSNNIKMNSIWTGITDVTMS